MGQSGGDCGLSQANPLEGTDSAVYTRRRLLVVTAAVLVPASAYSQLRRLDVQGAVARPAGKPATTPAPSAPDAPSITLPPTRVVPAASSTVTTAPGPRAMPIDHDLGRGMVGDEVRAVQTRLAQLAFDPGPADGIFGPATTAAVWVFEKFVLGTPPAAVTGVVTPAMWERMNTAIDVRPRRANPGSFVEILLPEQTAVVYQDNTPRLITHVSSGTGDEWCDVVDVDNDDGTTSAKGICGIATTPGGVFHFERREAGWTNSKLGELYNPIFFNFGIAIHGALNVPTQPASHGCVRIPMHIAEYFPSLVAHGDLVYVFDGVRQPETYGAQLPVFDYADPDWTAPTTTTSSTTISPPPTSLRPTTSGPPSAEVSTTSTPQPSPAASALSPAALPVAPSANA